MLARAAKPGIVLLGSDFKALGVARSLGKRGARSVVVDNTPRAAWLSRYVVDRRRWEGPMEGQEFVEFLLGLGTDTRYQGWVLIPTQDETVEIVARNHAALSNRFTLVTQPWETLRRVCEKSEMNALARSVGVAIPETWYPRDEAELATMDITYPAIIKPSVSIHMQHALRLKALPADTLDEMRAQYRRACEVIAPDEVMVQEIVPGGGAQQLSVALYARTGEIIASMTAQRTRQYPIDYGLGSSFVEAVEVPDVLEYAARIVREGGLTGMLEVEFKRDPRTGQPKLLDVNVRPWGWHTLAIASGLDFPAMQYCDAIGETYTGPLTPRYGVRWLRAITDLPAGAQLARAGHTTPWQYARSLVGRTTYSVWDWRDPAPALMDLGSVAVRFSRPQRSSAAMVSKQLTEPARV